jgi:hypothetical protein
MVPHPSAKGKLLPSGASEEAGASRLIAEAVRGW